MEIWNIVLLMILGYVCVYGIVNRILNKHEADALFYVSEGDLIRPTTKMKDLMPYFLSKHRVIEIQNWIKGEEKNAANQQSQNR